RWCLEERAVADALAAPARFVSDVATLARERAVDVILPVTEAALLALLPERARLVPACIPFADAEAMRRISDKALLMEAAPAAGIAVPAQHVLASPDDARAADLEALRYPVVVKPARSVGERDGARVKLGVEHAASAERLRALLSGIDPAAYPLLVQQRIVGPGVGIFLLLWEGELLATFAHRRIREKPPSGGVSVYRESIPADPALVARSRALLERFAWRGVAMVEYKLDAATGTPYLMEVNGRFWGSLQLAIDAGVNFPLLLLAAAAGERPAPVHDYRVPVRSRWEWGDVDHLIARLRRSSAELALPPGAPGRWRAALDVLTPWRPGDRLEVLRLGDPAPFFRETLDWLHRR
ncbi:MAG TPA: ATP-grasp domain-containing protein, partial [Gemmatimonadaceae bacterium]|nr:ATP-grasp domain-containing protein [Gemmatimonadaceae bacterium]